MIIRLTLPILAGLAFGAVGAPMWLWLTFLGLYVWLVLL